MVIESDPVARQFDTEPFVNYMSDELTTPTASELVEDLPEWKGREEFERKVQENSEKPRRGVGFLRSEPVPEKVEPSPKTPVTESAQTTDEFGDGLFTEPDSSDKNEDKTPAKRKRRRRRRKQNKTDDRQPATSEDAAEVAGGTAPAVDGKESKADDSGQGENTGRKRRRRRRRRRKPNEENQTSGD